MRNPSHLLLGTLFALTAASLSPLSAQNNDGNYKLASKYSSKFLRQFSYSTSVSPKWIDKSNRFWYSYRTSAGTKYWMVDAETRTKEPLFDHGIVAGAVTEASEKAADAAKLQVSSVKFDKLGKTFKFNASGFEFEYNRSTHEIKTLGKAKASSRTRGPGGRGGRGTGNLTREQIRQLIQRRGGGGGERTGRRGTTGREGGRQGRGSTRGGGARTARTPAIRKMYAPDKSFYIYAKDHNLFMVKGTPLPPAPAAAKKKPKITAASLTPESNGGEKDLSKAAKSGKGEAKTDEKKTPKKPEPRFRYDEKNPIQLSKDGVENYSFGGAARSSGTRGRTGRQVRGRSSRFSGRSNLNWAKDSSAFYTTRRDSRDIPDLFLVNSLASPRPSLQTYKYPMPGEARIRTTELHYYHALSPELTQLPKLWKDESYQNVAWHEGTGKLRFMRRDRLLRNVAYCALDPQTGKVETMFKEGSKDGYLKVQSMRFLKDTKEFLWWSERSGWGHYYLYGDDGKVKNPITRGAFRASSIVSLDEKARVLYFRANGREKGENIYYEHLYRVRLDGTGLTLLDPGDATHRSSLSPSKRFVVDNTSRVDSAPQSYLRDAEGNEIMMLEECDLSRLRQVGWKLPETFRVKAADGVTDLFGNMWKPFDFDPKKKYPIIAHVYPGPQQEGVTHTFASTSSRQQLAQIGFIVVQVGHRGGTPKRSRAYANYGYYNMRDYGLSDKKAAIEQLAMRHDFIDVERVGIYGHSGGGFMTAAALLQKPYNEFFKVGVSSAGNHDNNIYNNSWSERYHGLKEVEVKKEEKAKADTSKATTAKAVTKKTETKKTETKGTGKGGEKKVEKGKGTDQDTKAGSSSRRRRRSSWRQRLADRKKAEAAGKATGKKQEAKKETRFEIKIPTTPELAANLRGKLLLVHGEIDNNVHPANTMRLVDALIKANKRFDMLIIPGARHSFGVANEYFAHRMWEYFAEHLLGDRHEGADIKAKSK